MPVVSQAQNRFFRACQANRNIDGCPPAKVVNEFISATHGKKVRRLPEHKRQTKAERRLTGG